MIKQNKLYFNKNYIVIELNGTYLQRIFIHPGYGHKSLTEDYAILVMETPFNYTTQVGRSVSTLFLLSR